MLDERITTINVKCLRFDAARAEWNSGIVTGDGQYNDHLGEITEESAIPLQVTAPILSP